MSFVFLHWKIELNSLECTCIALLALQLLLLSIQAVLYFKDKANPKYAEISQLLCFAVLGLFSLTLLLSYGIPREDGHMRVEEPTYLHQDSHTGDQK